MTHKLAFGKIPQLLSQLSVLCVLATSYCLPDRFKVVVLPDFLLVGSSGPKRVPSSILDVTEEQRHDHRYVAALILHPAYTWSYLEGIWRFKPAWISSAKIKGF
jgi:hypothetical protein